MKIYFVGSKDSNNIEERTLALYFNLHTRDRIKYYLVIINKNMGEKLEVHMLYTNYLFKLNIVLYVIILSWLITNLAPPIAYQLPHCCIIFMSSINLVRLSDEPRSVKRTFFVRPIHKSHFLLNYTWSTPERCNGNFYVYSSKMFTFNLM